MKLSDLVGRDLHPQPWIEGEKIPWHDNDFSQRMLKEHLSQRNDAASRRTSVIKKQVSWIHTFVLNEKKSRILDLGCGPGFYTARLSKLGHTCHGIDFSPASIEYALKQAHENCSFKLGDIRTTEFGSGYDLIMFIFGEFNVFKPDDAMTILRYAYKALKPDGKILLEPQTFDNVYTTGNQPGTWYSAEKELFADVPHLCLMESFWDEELSVATERFFILDANTNEITKYVSSTQAYEDDELVQMLIEAGFQTPEFYPSLTGKEDDQSGLKVLTGIKRAGKLLSIG